MIEEKMLPNFFQYAVESPEYSVRESAWLEHIPFAMFLVSLHRPKLIVELGTHWGASYCAFCQAVEKTALPATCYAIDTWKGDEHAGFYGEEVFETLRNYHDPKYSKFSSLLRMTFDEGLDYFSDGSIDLLHIDALHTYEAVKHDFENWLPKLSEQGVVLFHDISERKNDFGVWRFWEEIRATKPSFEFYHGHGLGILGVGKNLPKQTLQFLECNEPQGYRYIFSCLGEKIRLMHEVDSNLNRLNLALIDQKNRVGMLEAELKRKEDFLSSTETEQGEAKQKTVVVEEEKLVLKTKAKEINGNDHLRTKNIELNTEICDYVTSNRWLLTRPLRRAKNLLTRGNMRKLLRYVKHYMQIKKTELFDRNYYLTNYPDVRRAGVDPLWHFVKFGWKEGRNPSASFNTTSYLDLNLDVAAAGVNPLVHYLRFGAKENRKLKNIHSRNSELKA